MSNPNPSGFATRGGGYIAFAHVAGVRRDKAANRTIVSFPTRDVAFAMPSDEHADFIGALTYWASGA